MRVDEISPHPKLVVSRLLLKDSHSRYISENVLTKITKVNKSRVPYSG